MSGYNNEMLNANNVNLFSREIKVWKSNATVVDTVTPAKAQEIISSKKGYLLSTQDVILWD